MHISLERNYIISKDEITTKLVIYCKRKAVFLKLNHNELQTPKDLAAQLHIMACELENIEE